MERLKRAVFLDRDGTLNWDVGYLNNPAQVELLPGVAPALRAFREAGYMLVCVTNQSGVARGLITEEQIHAIHQRLAQLLEQQGVTLDACYYCPYHPEGTMEPFIREAQGRKPRPGMLLQAAKELNLDLTQSWMIGDSGRDVNAGLNAGCATIWLTEQKSEHPAPQQVHAIARNWEEAAQTLLRMSQEGVNGSTTPRHIEELLPPDSLVETLYETSLAEAQREAEGGEPCS